jgi:hypothetical protein
MAFISSGTTIIDNGAFQASLGSLVHIKTLTASSSATLSFVHGTDGVVLDNTYPIYKFEFINIHPSSNSANFQVGFRDGGTAYDATKTTTSFKAQHNEGDTQAVLEYHTGSDLAQSTAFQTLEGSGNQLSSDNDHGLGGELTLYNPSSTTFVKHFMSRTSATNPNDFALDGYIAGYCNVTAAIDGVQFKMSSGNIDSGKIKLFGIKDS